MAAPRDPWDVRHPELRRYLLAVLAFALGHGVGATAGVAVEVFALGRYQPHRGPWTAAVEGLAMATALTAVAAALFAVSHGFFTAGWRPRAARLPAALLGGLCGLGAICAPGPPGVAWGTWLGSAPVAGLLAALPQPRRWP